MGNLLFQEGEGRGLIEFRANFRKFKEGTPPVSTSTNFKAGLNQMPAFPPLNLGLMRISRSRFKQ